MEESAPSDRRLAERRVEVPMPATGGNEDMERTVVLQPVGFASTMPDAAGRVRIGFVLSEVLKMLPPKEFQTPTKLTVMMTSAAHKRQQKVAKLGAAVSAAETSAVAADCAMLRGGLRSLSLTAEGDIFLDVGGVELLLGAARRARGCPRLVTTRQRTVVMTVKQATNAKLLSEP